MLKDIEREVEAFLHRRKERLAKKGNEYSLWDDIAGIGGEFVEFLEEASRREGSIYNLFWMLSHKHLYCNDPPMQGLVSDPETRGRKARDEDSTPPGSTKSKRRGEPQPSLEDELAALKRKLGLI